MAHSLEYSLNKAKKMLRKGHLEDAKKAFESILIAFPGNIRARDGLASCQLVSDKGRPEGNKHPMVNEIIERFSAGDHQGVIELSEEFLHAYPKNADILLKLGASYGISGIFDKALHCFETVMELQPQDPAPYNNIGTILKMQDKVEEAIGYYRQALELDPQHFDSLKNIGFCFDNQGKKDDAIIYLEKALHIRPENVELRNHLGSLYSKTGNPDKAEACYNKVLKFQPDFKAALNNLGNIHYGRQQYEQAIELYEKAILSDPSYGDAYNNLANVLKDIGYLDEAILNYEKALEFQPDKAELHSNYSVALKDRFKLDLALEAVNKAIALKPDMYDAHWNKALALLADKNFSEGWKNYEWRWKATNFDSVYLETQKPLWNGKKERVLIWQEQGIGDQIMFATMFEEFAKCCELPIFQVDLRLLPIFRRTYPQFHFIPGNKKLAEHEYDSHLPMGSMCQYLRNSEKDFVDANPTSLKADTISAQKIRQAFRIGDKCLVGISWRSVNKQTGLMRSLTLEEFIRPFQGKDVELVNLQYGDCKAEINDAYNATGVAVKSVNEIDTFTNIDHLASLIEACDRVITIDNSTVHLAASMGKTTDLLLPFVTDWRWCGGDKVPLWYKSLNVHKAPYGVYLKDFIKDLVKFVD